LKYIFAFSLRFILCASAIVSFRCFSHLSLFSLSCEVYPNLLVSESRNFCNRISVTCI
jgi:hypothetical protein